MPSFALRPCPFFIGAGKKSKRSLLNGSLIRLASTTELMHVNFGTTDAKGHRVLLPQVGSACLYVAVLYACMFVGMKLVIYTADTISTLSRILHHSRLCKWGTLNVVRAFFTTAASHPKQGQL